MASLLSRLFGGLFGGGGAGGADAPPDPAKAVDYNGYRVHPHPRRQGSAWLTAGLITKEVDGAVREHSFVRADTFPTREDAEQCAVEKAKRIVDERGDRMFGET